MAFPIHVQLDLPGPLVHSDDPGWAYNHRFSAPDTDYTLDNVWRDPARHTVMLQPWPLLADYRARTDGLLRRLGVNDFWTDSGVVSAHWEESRAFGTAGDTFLLSITDGERLTTARSWPPNQAFFLRAFAFGGYGGRGPLFELEWGIPAVGSDLPHYRMLLSADGAFVLQKRQKTDAGPMMNDVFTGYLTPETRDRSGLQQKYFELMVLPYRRNETLFWSSLGAYPVFTDPDIDPLVPNGPAYRGNGGNGGASPGYGDVSETDWVITETGHASIIFPAQKGYFQLMPLVYRTGSDGTGGVTPATPPAIGYFPNSANFRDDLSPETTIDADTPPGSGVSLVPGCRLDHTDDTLDWNLALSGNQPDPAFPDQSSTSPFVYGFEYVIPPGEQATNDDPVDAGPYVRRLVRRYTEDGSSCELEIKDPRSISEQYMSAVHRYCRVYWVDGIGQENELFYGIATEPDFDEWPASPDGHDHTPVSFTVYDPWWDFETTQLVNLRALDGMKVHEAVHAVLDVMGWPRDRRDIDETEFSLPKDPTGEEKLVLTEQVGSAKDILLHLRDDFTTAEVPPYKWRMDFAPVLLSGQTAYKICFRFKNPELLPDVVSGGQTRTLYGRKAAAVAAGATPDSFLRSFRRKVLEPEANYIEVWGVDPDGAPILSTREDPKSQDPDLAFADRPLNWIGRRRELVYVNTSFNSDAQCSQAATALYNRLVLPRITAEATAEHRDDDVLGMILKLDHESRRYTVTEFEVEHVLETAQNTVRNATYTLEARA